MNQKTALKQLKFIENHDSIKSMRLAAENWTSDFQILVSTILSARTRDEVTIPTAENLFRKFPTAEKLSKAKIQDVMKIVKPVNFYRNKSRNVISCAKKICEDYNKKIPREIDELVNLSGVGRKTASVFISELGKDAIAVDTHVAYISQKLGWTKNKNPEKIEDDLKKLFPKNMWKVINPALVRFGKTHTSRKQKDGVLEEIKKVK